jgi:hypothetical protein
MNYEQKKISLEDYLRNGNFSKDSIWYIDRICRLTDGGGINKTTLYQFLQLLNQNFFYSLMQPKLPNDKLLFKLINDKLLENNVDIILNEGVVNFTREDKQIISVVTVNKTIYGKKFILCMPPMQIYDLTQNINAFDKKFKDFAEKTNYETYIAMTFHWKDDLQLNSVWGFPKTDWGLAFIVLSDYMKFDESKTVISVCISIQEKSKNINKTPNECSEKELIKEVFEQLQISFPGLIYPTTITFDNKKIDNKWKSKDTAFISTIYGYISNETNYVNLYNCGTHNGHHDYNFTSIESSVENAFYLLDKLENYKIKTRPIFTVRYFMVILICMFILLKNI